MPLLAELVSTSSRVGDTSSRLAKVREIARLLGTLSPEEIGIGVSYLAGELPQGRVGVGYAALQAAAATAAAAPTEANLSVEQTDRYVAELAAIRGGGSARRRSEALRISSPERPPKSERSSSGSWSESCVRGRLPG